MNEETNINTDIAELDRMEFDIFKKYWQPMMKELIELQELRDAVPTGDVGAVKRMTDDITALKQGFEELKGIVTGAMRPATVQPTASYPQYPMNSGMYNPGLVHMPMYRAGQPFVVAPVTQANQ